MLGAWEGGPEQAKLDPNCKYPFLLSTSLPAPQDLARAGGSWSSRLGAPSSPTATLGSRTCSSGVSPCGHTHKVHSWGCRLGCSLRWRVTIRGSSRNPLGRSEKLSLFLFLLNVDVPPGALGFQEKPAVGAGLGGPGEQGAVFRHFPLIKYLVVEINGAAPAPSCFLPTGDERGVPAGSLSSFCRKLGHIILLPKLSRRRTEPPVSKSTSTRARAPSGAQCLLNNSSSVTAKSESTTELCCSWGGK